MKVNKLKSIVIMLSVILFFSCKSAGSEQKKDDSQRGPGGQPSIAQLFEQMDANKDGKLSASEVKGPLKNDFSKIDNNDDGFLSEEEIEAAPKPERQRGQGRPN